MISFKNSFLISFINSLMNSFIWSHYMKSLYEFIHMISFMNSYLVNLSTWFQRSIRDFTGIQEDKWWWFWSCLFHSGGSRWTATVLLSCVAMTPIAHCNNDDSCFGLGCGKGSCIICCCIKSWFVQYFLQMSIPFLHLVQSWQKEGKSSHVFSSCLIFSLESLNLWQVMSRTWAGHANWNPAAQKCPTDQQ